MIHSNSVSEGLKSHINNFNNSDKYTSHCSNESIVIPTIFNYDSDKNDSNNKTYNNSIVNDSIKNLKEKSITE